VGLLEDPIGRLAEEHETDLRERRLAGEVLPRLAEQEAMVRQPFSRARAKLRRTEE
jgi:hypothetical protein